MIYNYKIKMENIKLFKYHRKGKDVKFADVVYKAACVEIKGECQEGELLSGLNFH